MTDQTIFERAARAIWDAGEEMQAPRCRMRWEDGTHLARLTAANNARAVIQTIIEHTGSPRTAEELTRILGEA